MHLRGEGWSVIFGVYTYNCFLPKYILWATCCFVIGSFLYRVASVWFASCQAVPSWAAWATGCQPRWLHKVCVKSSSLYTRECLTHQCGRLWQDSSTGTGVCVCVCVCVFVDSCSATYIVSFYRRIAGYGMSVGDHRVGRRWKGSVANKIVTPVCVCVCVCVYEQIKIKFWEWT